MSNFRIFGGCEQIYETDCTSFSIYNDELIILPYYVHDIISNGWISLLVDKLNSGEKEESYTLGLLVTELAKLISRMDLLSPNLILVLNKYIDLLKFPEIRKSHRPQLGYRNLKVN